MVRERAGATHWQGEVVATGLVAADLPTLTILLALRVVRGPKPASTARFFNREARIVYMRTLFSLSP